MIIIRISIDIWSNVRNLYMKYKNSKNTKEEQLYNVDEGLMLPDLPEVHT